MVKGDIINEGPVNLPAWSVVIDAKNRILQKLDRSLWTDLDTISFTNFFYYPVEVIRVGP